MTRDQPSTNASPSSRPNATNTKSMPALDPVTFSVIWGGLLSTAASWALVRFVFDAPFSVPAGPLAALCGGVAAMAVVVGLLQERGVLRRPALEVLRTE